MKVLLAALGLSETATEAQGLAALTAINVQHDSAIAALRSQKPDPAAYVDIGTFSAVQAELASIKASTHAAEVSALVAEGLADGRILPAAEAWARQYGESDMAGLRTFLDKAPKVAALQGMQSGAKTPANTGADALTDDELAVCRALGVSAADYVKTRNGE